MIFSMTGYGRAEVSEKKMTASAEVRSVNNRFLEVSSRLPRTISLRENDVKEIVRSKFIRGKVNVVITFLMDVENPAPLKINTAAVKSYYALLAALKKTTKSKEKITLDHLLKFPEIFDADNLDHEDEKQWTIAEKALRQALDDAVQMRAREGEHLMQDISQRIRQMETTLGTIERLAATRIPEERARLEERVRDLIQDRSIIDNNRLELELVLLADKLDVTEECVRFKSHTKFFLHGLAHEEAAGRKLNFLLQEMNREANTIGSKANNAEIAHLIVSVKEELEKIREQLQNIE